MATKKKPTKKKTPKEKAAKAAPREAAPAAAAAAPGRTLLVVDDQPEIADFIQELVEERDLSVRAAASAEEALELAADGARVDAVILDLNLGEGRMSGLEALPRFREALPDCPVIMLTGEGTIRRAVDALKQGAADFIAKDSEMEDHVEVALARLEQVWGLVEENRDLRQRVADLEQAAAYFREDVYKKYKLVGVSPAVKEVVAFIEEVAPIPRPLLIRGERGTGKELVAAAIHKASPRSGGPFVTINCASFAEGLLECEMFGQEEGGYTDARFRKGRFELAHKGTLFLDEVGNMPLPFQEKMLRVLEYQEFSRVGGSTTIKVDVRVVAATNADLETAMAAGKFREDLYDRLAFETVWLPPLRERKEDLAALAHHFMGILALEAPGDIPEGLSAEAAAALEGYDWPGNVREFKNYIERVAYRARAKVLEVDHLLPFGRRSTAPEFAPGATLVDRLRFCEERILRHALEGAGGDRVRAGQKLGIELEELARRLAEHGLESS